MQPRAFIYRLAYPGGFGLPVPREPAYLASGAMDGAAQTDPSERSPGWAQRTSGDGVWVARSRLGAKTPRNRALPREAGFLQVLREDPLDLADRRRLVMDLSMRGRHRDLAHHARELGARHRNDAVSRSTDQ